MGMILGKSPKDHLLNVQRHLPCEGILYTLFIQIVIHLVEICFDISYVNTKLKTKNNKLKQRSIQKCLVFFSSLRNPQLGLAKYVKD